MPQNQTLYQYLYQTLVTQIKSGGFLQQRTFPTQNQLCKQYNVGITTVRKVIKLLHEEGYIQAIPGKSAIVTYEASLNSYISALVERKEEVHDAFLGLGYLLPHLYKEAAKYCKENELSIMQHAIDDINETMDILSLYHQTNLFFTTLMKSFQNPLIIDLELDAENFLHIPFIPYQNQQDPFYRTASCVQNWLSNINTYVIEQQIDMIYEKVSATYVISNQRVMDYFEVLEQHTKPISPSIKKDISWFHVRERSELYAHLAMTIMRRITKGEFSNQKYLPSIPKIMKEYGVMKETASRSIALLNSLGITQSINKKGTILLTDKSHLQITNADFHDPIIKQRIVYCLDALQLIALSINSSIPFAPNQINDLSNNIKQSLEFLPNNKISPVLVQLLMDFIMKSVSTHSLKNIYQQLNDLLVWGYYLTAVDESLYPDIHNMEKAIYNLKVVLDQNNSEAILDAIKQIFYQIYHDIYYVMLQLPYDFGTLPIPLS